MITKTEGKMENTQLNFYEIHPINLKNQTLTPTFAGITLH